MARGLGTALGVALVTLSLHLGGGASGHGDELALFGLALVAVVAGATGFAVTTSRSGRE